MPLLTTRMLRSFTIGFALGAIAVASFAGAANVPGGNHLVPSALAAPAR